MLPIAIVMAAACSDARVQKQRHLDAGERYMSRGAYRPAIVEFRHALDIEPTDRRALRRLGLAQHRSGQHRAALETLLRAAEPPADDLDLRLDIGSVQLALGRPGDAWDEARFVLDRAPNNLEALVLATSSAKSAEQIEAASGRFAAVATAAREHAGYHVALGNLYLRRREIARAEVAFTDAIKKDAASVEARVALARLYAGTGQATRADQVLQLAAGIAPAPPAARLMVADVYLLLAKPDDATRVLRAINEQMPDYLPAWRGLAEVAFSVRRFEESLAALQKILTVDAADPHARLLRGRIHMAKGEIPAAVREFEDVVRSEPGLATPRYHLATAHVQAGLFSLAKRELVEAVSIAPGFDQAALLLAELYVKTDAPKQAITELERLVARQPESLDVHRLLGRAYLASGESVKATAAFRRAAALAPHDPSGPHLVGLALRAQGQAAEAKRHFEAALRMAPRFADPLIALVDMALKENRSDLALERVERQIARAPDAGSLYYLLGKVHQARREWTSAEAAYRKSVELEPYLADAYVELGRLFATSHQYEKAIAELTNAVSAHPKGLAAQMLLGALYRKVGYFGKAQKVYEEVLAIEPGFPPAAGALALLYADHTGNTGRALQLAQAARAAAPDDAHVAHSLGWVLYKLGHYDGALAVLRESLARLPDDAEIQFHLGMAALKVGDRASARKALTDAIGSARLDDRAKREATAALESLN